MTNWWWGRNDDLEIRDATRNWDAIDKLYSEYDSLKIDYPYGQFVPEVDDISLRSITSTKYIPTIQNRSLMVNIRELRRRSLQRCSQH